MAKRATRKEPTYREAAERLETILRTLEEGEVDIDELSGLVREAAELVTLCRKKIRAAEVQVRTIAEQLEQTEAPEEAGGAEAEEEEEESAPADADAPEGEEPPF